jgi:CPA2 family monovalent cation:H+ antiporter-2
VVVTLPDPALQRLVIQQIRAVCRDKPIIARAETMDDLPYLYEDGAHDVILPEFEGGLAMLRQALLRFDVATETIQNYIDMIHAGRYEPWHKTDTRSQLLSMLRRASSGLYPQWYQLAPDSVHEQRTINALNIRQQTGASVVAIVRDSKFLVNPEADTTLQRGDRLAVLGNEDQRRQFVEWLSDGEPGSVVPASPAVLHDAHEQNR